MLLTLKIFAVVGPKIIVVLFKLFLKKLAAFIEFDNVRVLRMDTDTTRRKNSYDGMIEAFKNQEGLKEG